ncbi:glutamine-hydrolyzing carbamoyl-phosphate synthase small subunit [Salibacteraceae bacterium]|jgi:carbamoyl-phosphate synthase small subunit|nr:glutamine-hydrolyzing carbamoyl-phosphate synthase small subunit [Salibacteraceae bacterium]MDB9709818.1 glutamine-hydrolyzing carbamoyl-phosphate synthase small subunit [Salibacteraceae bacterium]
MKYKEGQSAVILLEDGTHYWGKAAGLIGTTTGEIAFNTGMTGYQEIFTDPSYFGQILLMTTSHIGNYGIHDEEVESESVKISGLVCKKFSQIFSRVASDESIQAYFERQNLVGISDVDTRALVRHVRDKGAMNAIISSEILDLEELKAKLAKVPSMEGLELSSKVCTKEVFEFGDPNSDFKVSVIDFGVKTNILRCLSERGCYLKVFPMDASAQEITSWNPDGIMLSNGPGDPSAMNASVKLIQDLLEINIPMFGICLGHQLLSIAAGLTTYKMHNGHRGINHPILNIATGKCEITSQNHGFVVDRKVAEQRDDIEITHVHLNDDTLAGIRLKNKNAFSVQYHPESSAGPHDSRYLFDDFVEMIRSVKHQTIEA